MIAAFEFDAIGTAWRISLEKELLPERRAALFRIIMDRIEIFDAAYSRFRPDSLVTKMSQESGDYVLPMDAIPLFHVYRRLYDLTKGAFTPLIGKTLADAGYDAAYSFVSKPLSSPPAWDDVMEFYMEDDVPHLFLHAPVLLDFGAGGKGYLVDILGEILEREGVSDFLINAGGDIVYKGSGVARIGLEDPRDTTQAIGFASLVGGSICGSSGSRRTWGSFHHTIDPHALISPQHILATWAIAPSALLADALATALYFAPALALYEAFHFDYLIMYADGQVEHSPYAPIELFTA